jgi:hypothetical protein
MELLKAMIPIIFLCFTFAFASCKAPDTDQTRNSNESENSSNSQANNQSGTTSSTTSR